MIKSGMETSHCHHFQEVSCKEYLNVSERKSNTTTCIPQARHGDTDVMCVAASVTGMQA
jgi:hypothetical protein